MTKQNPILSRDQIAKKYGLWKWEEIDKLYQQQFKEKIRVVDIITKAEVRIRAN